MNHTKGPWHLADYNTDDGDNDVIDSMGRVIAEVNEWGEYPTSANAQLIAAAPDLFEALEMVMGSYILQTGSHQETAEMKRARTYVGLALDKARGEML